MTIKKNDQAVIFEDVRFAYCADGNENRKEVIDHFDLSVPDGSRTALFGPSGAGKSTLLKLIAGIQKPDDGRLSVSCKRISMVFQKDMLFDQLSVLDNIRYGLPKGSVPEAERTQKARMWAKRFRCSDLLDRKTATLSGGQRQRVALARAFMKDPDLLLMDESFQGFDTVLREELINEILELHARMNFTLILITHSYVEAMKTTQSLVLIEHGKVLRQCPVWQAANDPQSLFTAGALGYFPMNLLELSTPFRRSVSSETRHLIPEQASWLGFYPWKARPVSFQEHALNSDPACIRILALNPDRADLGFGKALLFSEDGWKAEVFSQNSSVSDPDEICGFEIEEPVFFDESGKRI